MSTGIRDYGRPDEHPAGGRFRPGLTGSLLNRRAPGGMRAGAALIWLGFIVFPLVDAIGKHEPVLRHGLVIGGAALFVAAYVGMVMSWRGGTRQTRLPLIMFVVLLAFATALTLSNGSSWGFLFTYCAACGALVAPEDAGFYAVALCSTLAGVASALAGASGGTVVSYVASSAGIGLLMLVMSDLRLRNAQLSEARAELARMAVAEERERFARDLHDLLGHSLSVITLKAELAGRMLTNRPADAAREVAELEQVARTALSEVREAVSGYRQPTLEGELAGARLALAAAGIEADVQESRVPLDPAVEAVLAWTIREGATNVIRHSGARHCTFRLSASLTDAGVEVIDDGFGAPEGGSSGNGNGATPRPGPDGRGQAGGHGIAGLAERARLVNGTIEAGGRAGGGYRLAVTVPVSHA
jgi:two-component system, NarL family, sensor histidine kinase DesK